MTALRAFLAASIVTFCCLGTPLAQGAGPISAGGAAPEPGGGAATDSLTSSETLSLARTAFREAEYARLVPLLQPIIDAELDGLSDGERADARQLYAVGLFFQAQQATRPGDREVLLDGARASFLELLRESPDFQLDPLLYPASVVELFEEVVEANSDELDELRLKDGDPGGPAIVETVYIERQATRNRFPLIFLPFAVGQFQNGDLVKGTLLGSIQAGALALNFTSFLVIESLRNQGDGRYDVDSGNYANALAWRNVLYGSLITFGVAYAISVIDAWTFFEEYDVNIRTLDGPPPELTDVPGSGAAPHPLGFVFDIAW